MYKIEFNTHIKAPIERCFDLARSVDFHKISVSEIKEESLAGIRTGLIGPNQHVLLQNWIGGLRFSTEMKLTQFARPHHFSYLMVNNIFRKVIHDYHFYDLKEETVMVDHLYFEPRFGMLGEIINFLFLRKFLIRILTQRNDMLREYAETDKWSSVLTPQTFAEK